MHGAHRDPQKFNSTTLPLSFDSSADCDPSLMENAGATLFTCSGCCPRSHPAANSINTRLANVLRTICFTFL